MNAGANRVISLSRLEIALTLMALTSVIAMLLPSELLRTSFELNPTNYPVQLHRDDLAGGNSKAYWLDERSQHWACDLASASHTPFCSLQLDITNAEGKGLDLRNYDKITIWADYRGSATRLRFYLRNRHPNYYIPENSMSTKYNMIEVPIEDLSKGLELTMKDFTVAGWWLIGGNIPLAYSHPEFNDVSIVEVQTGSMDHSGHHEIQLQKIVWGGRLISQERLYQGILIAWTIFIFGMLIFRLLNMTVELKKHRAYQQELLAINAALNLESRHYEDLAKTDALTGILNRVGIRDILHQGVKDWRDNGTPLSFIIIDLDNFKRINDTHGHDVGDQILKDASQLMLSCVRSTDAFARWGGEEFVLVCPETTLERALQAAEHLRSQLEENFRYQGETITASFGVSTMSEPNLDHLFKKADKALYTAKKLGRNCACTEERKQLRTA